MMMWLINYIHALAAAVLVGKVVLLSFVVAPILAKNLEREPFGKVVRQLFPAYYVLGMVTAVVGLLAVGATMALQGGSLSLLFTGGIWLIVLIAESYCHSPLTPETRGTTSTPPLQLIRIGWPFFACVMTGDSTGSTAILQRGFFRTCSIYRLTPVIVPPVPTPETRMSTLPSVSSQISGPVVLK